MVFGPRFDIYRFALAVWACDLFLKLFLTSLFWLGLGIHKIPREREV